VCLWLLLVPPAVGTGWRYLSAFGSLLFVLAVVARLLTSPLTMSRGQLPGAWAGEKVG
jgi:hypothetical protein